MMMMARGKKHRRIYQAANADARNFADAATGGHAPLPRQSGAAMWGRFHGAFLVNDSPSTTRCSRRQFCWTDETLRAMRRSRPAVLLTTFRLGAQSPPFKRDGEGSGPENSVGQHRPSLQAPRLPIEIYDNSRAAAY